MKAGAPKGRRAVRNPKSLHERALGLLGVRARSRAELERRLAQAGFEPEEVREELDRLERVGLVDDEAFARQVLDHSLESRLEGRRMAVGRLMAAGVSRDTVGRVMGEFDDDEDDRALELATSRAARLGSVPPEKAFQRLTGLLARRGYPPEVARRAARRALGAEAFDG